MKYLLVIVTLIAASLAADDGNCTIPLNTFDTNALLQNITFLNESITADFDLSVCKNLEGQQVCCAQEGFDQLKENYDSIKQKFIDFVERRKQRIENITNEFANVDKFLNITKLLSDDDALFDLADKIPGLKLVIKALNITSPFKSKKFNDSGHDEDDEDDRLLRFL